MTRWELWRAWWTRRVDGVAMWLANHGRAGAAERLWKITRLW